MSRHGLKRTRPRTARARHRELHQRAHGLLAGRGADARQVLADPSAATSRATRWDATTTRSCARRLQSSATDRRGDRPLSVIAPSRQRPGLEKALARNAGLGWIGKHTNLIERDAGSYFFLGEIYLDLELPAEPPATAHCGTLQRLPAGLPDRRDRRALPARCAPLHFLPHHRAEGPDSGRAPPRHRQPHLRLRRLPARLPVEQIRTPGARRRLQVRHGLDRPRSSLCSAGARGVPAAKTRAAPFAASATSAGCATSRWRSAMHRLGGGDRGAEGSRQNDASRAGAGARALGARRA
jgi:hypothetical protein